MGKTAIFNMYYMQRTDRVQMKCKYFAITTACSLQTLMCFVECKMQIFFSKFTTPKQTTMLNKPSESQWLRLCQHLSAIFLGTTVQLGKIYPSLASSSKINQSLLNLEEKNSLTIYHAQEWRENIKLMMFQDLFCIYWITKIFLEKIPCNFSARFPLAIWGNCNNCLVDGHCLGSIIPKA